MKETLISFGIIGLVMIGILLHLQYRALKPFGCASSIKNFAACMDKYRVLQNRIRIYTYGMCVVPIAAMFISSSGWLLQFPVAAIYSIFGMLVASVLLMVSAILRKPMDGYGYSVGMLLWTATSMTLVFVGVA